MSSAPEVQYFFLSRAFVNYDSTPSMVADLFALYRRSTSSGKCFAGAHSFFSCRSYDMTVQLMLFWHLLAFSMWPVRWRLGRFVSLRRYGQACLSFSAQFFFFCRVSRRTVPGKCGLRGDLPLRLRSGSSSGRCSVAFRDAIPGRRFRREKVGVPQGGVGSQ